MGRGTTAGRRSPGRPALSGRRAKPVSAGRLASAGATVGYDRQSEWRIQLTREIVVGHAEALARMVHEAMVAPADEPRLRVPDSDQGHDGAPGSTHLRSVKSWLSQIDGPLDEQAAVRLAEFARAHTRRADDPAAHVPARHLVLAFGRLQVALVALFAERIDDRAELLATVIAWDKLLMVHLDMVLATYDRLAGGGHWY